MWLFRYAHILIVPWYHTDREQWPNAKDPALDHPMSPRIVQIQQIYKRLREETGKTQPLLKPARSVPEFWRVRNLGADFASQLHIRS